MNFFDILPHDEGHSPRMKQVTADFTFTDLVFGDKPRISEGLFGEVPDLPAGSHLCTHGSPEQHCIYSCTHQFCLDGLARCGDRCEDNLFKPQADFAIEQPSYFTRGALKRRLDSNSLPKFSPDEEYLPNKLQCGKPKQEPLTSQARHEVEGSFSFLPLDASFDNTLFRPDCCSRTEAGRKTLPNDPAEGKERKSSINQYNPQLEVELNKKIGEADDEARGPSPLPPHQSKPDSRSSGVKPKKETIKSPKRKRTCKPPKNSQQNELKTTGFRRANDVAYLEHSYDDLEKRMAAIQSQGRARGVKSKEKQRMWNQVSSLKNRIWNREHSITMEGLAKKKDKEFQIFSSALEEVARSDQLDLIKKRIESKWAAIDADYQKKWPLQIQEYQILLHGEARPRLLGKRAQAFADRSRASQDKPAEKESSLFQNFITQEFVFRHFQRNDEVEE